VKTLARFVMGGIPQAALVAAVAALLSLFLPLLGIASSAAVALVTMRLGLRQGAAVAGVAGLGCALLGAALLGSAWPALASLLILWLPVWALGATLRVSRSLDLTVLAAGLAGAAMVLAIHGLLQDPAAAWQALLEPFRAALVKDGMIEEADSQVLFHGLAPWMTGAFVAALVLQSLVGLFLGRWWQALLYNPGGFGEEFRRLRLHRSLGLAGLALLAGIALVKGPGLVPDLLTVLTPLWLLQGLAAIHYLHRARGAHSGWLVGLYVLMVVLMPHAELLVACLGLVDNWADVRSRLGGGASGRG